MQESQDINPDRTLIRCSNPADPNRCQTVHGSQQCPYLAVEGKKYCPRHGGFTQSTLEKKVLLKKYFSVKWQESIGFQTNHPDVLNLREEVGVLRVMLSNYLDKLDTPNDWIIHSSKITEILREITKSVQSCERIEKSLNQVLDRSQAMVFINEIIDIVARYVNDPEILQHISEDTESTLTRLTIPKV